MKVITGLVQGTEAWLAHRLTHFNASDASAALGCSPYKTRDELKRELFAGASADVSKFVQERVYDKGHRFEALARPLGESFMGEDLAPLVGTEGKFSASFDGLTMMEDKSWEHKTLNELLLSIMVDGCTGVDLPLYHQVQMEHQCLVCPTIEQVLFSASKWDRNFDYPEDHDLGWKLIEIRHCWYTPNLALREQIVQAWALLDEEMCNYTPPSVAVPVVAKTMPTLPALVVKATGTIAVTHELEKYNIALTDLIENTKNKPTTDQQFADADAAAKQLRDAQDAAVRCKDILLSQTGDVDTVVRMLEGMEQRARLAAIALENLVKAQKTFLKDAAIRTARDSYAAEVARLNTELGESCLSDVPAVVAAITDATKNKRSLTNLEAAVNEAAATLKLAARAEADKFRTNIAALGAVTEVHAHLFKFDRAALLRKDAEDLVTLVKLRTSEFDANEKKRKDDEDERVRVAAVHLSAANGVIANHAAIVKGLADATVEQLDAWFDQLEDQSFDAETHGTHVAALDRSYKQTLTAVQTAHATAIQAAADAARPAANDPAPLAAEQDDEENADLFAPAAITPAPAAPPAPAPRVLSFPTRAPAAPVAVEDDGQRITLGQINTILAAAGVQTSGAGLVGLGFAHVGKDKAALLFRKSDVPAIAHKIIERLTAAVAEAAAA